MKAVIISCNCAIILFVSLYFVSLFGLRNFWIFLNCRKRVMRPDFIIRK